VIANLERDVFGDLGTLPVTAIGAAEILATLKGRGPRGDRDGAPARQRISAIFTYAIGAGRVLTAKPPARRWPAVTMIKKVCEVLRSSMRRKRRRWLNLPRGSWSLCTEREGALLGPDHARFTPLVYLAEVGDAQ